MKILTKILLAMLAIVAVISISPKKADAAMAYKMEVTIYYKNEAGQIIAPTLTDTVNGSDANGSWESPVVDGYELKDFDDRTVTYQMLDKKFPASNYIREGTATYTVYYTDTTSAKIYYCYNDEVNSQAAPTVTHSGKIGTTFAITSPTITGFRASSTVVRGTYGVSSDANIYVYYYHITYTVRFNANGGTGAPAAQTKGYSLDLKLSSTRPTRSGYTFQGWAESSTATTATYQPGGTYTRNVGTTLYAVWKQNVTSYTITFDANGGSGAPAPMTKQKDVALIIPNTVPTRNGYTFTGWGIGPTAIRGSFQPGGKYSGNKNTTLYAIWEKNPEAYTVKYDTNGGAGGPSNQTKIENVTLILAELPPIWQGYNFLGWATSASSTTVVYHPKDEYTENKSITLYAVWQKITYTISYNANGGSGTPSSQTKYFGTSLTLSSTKPTRTGYTFLGWSESSSATSVTYQAGASYTANKSTTLYAIWQRISYTVSYNENGGTGAPSTQTKYYGDTLTLSSTKPTRTGYTFLGWSESSSATSATYQAGASYTANKSTTLYAIWQRISYTVSYNANGGTGAPSTQTKYYGDTLTLSSTKPTRTGYTFLGWSESSSATSATYQAGGSYAANKSTTLYAVWKRIEYTISYDANGGSGAPSSHIKYYGTDVNISTTVPTREQYRFLGWSDDKNATNPRYTSGAVYSANASVKLFAVWQFINYDFTLKDLTIAPTEVYQYELVNISFRIDNGDKYAPYYAVPVEVLLNDKVIYSVDIDIAADGVKYINFNLGVGALLGTQTITVNVNKANLSKEIVSTDNAKSANFNVLKVVDAAVESVFTGNDSRYIEGTEVVSSFFVKNVSGNDIIPADNAKFVFKVYTLQNGREKVIFTRTRTDIVVPKNKANIVYFKWTVPNGLAGTPCWCNGSIEIAEGEPNKNNNATEFAVSIASMPKSDTPNTRYEDKAPLGYSPNFASPSLGTSSVSWNEWVYENNTFVLKEYGITVSGTSPRLTPSVNAVTATKVNNVWTMRSGYGFTLEWEPEAVSTSGKAIASADSYTQIQYVYAMYPEFSYSTAQDKYSTLDKISDKFILYKNVNAANEERIHFIPIYVADGKYTVTVAAGEVWTPAGVIHAKRNVSLNIDGSIYDDWYQ